MVFQNNLLAGASGVTGAQAAFDTTLIGNSVWLDGSDDYLNRTPSSAGNRTRWTLAWWFQLNAVATDMTFFSANVGSNDFFIRMDGTSNQQITVQDDNASGSMKTVAMQRDVGWYHCIVSLDTNQSSENDRVRVYINGELQELTTHGTFGTFNSGGETFWNNNQANEIGRRSRTSSSYANAYMAQICFLNADSIQNGDVAVSDFLDTFTFGTNGSQFIPKTNSDIAALATAAGGNSFCLDFADTSNFGNDISGNSPSGENDFTANNMSSANQSENTPSNSYPILNVLDPTTATASSGNLNFAGPSADNKAAMRTTIGIPDNSGKFYWEYALTGGSNDAVMIGIAGDGSANGGYDDWVQDITPQVAVYTEGSGNVLYVDGSNTNSSFFGSSPTGGDVIGVAYDSDTRKVWFALNNTYAGSGNPAAGSGESATLSSSGTAFPTVSARGSSDTLTLRFDSSDFSYSAPTGYKELNTANLTAPTYQGIDYFDATLYKGNGDGQRVGDFVPFTDAYTVDKSAMFEEADKRYLSFTPSAGGDQKTFTFSTWFKLAADAGSQRNTFLSSGTTGGKQAQINLMGDTSEKDINVNMYNGSSFLLNLNTDRAFLDQSQWNHLVVAIDTRAAVASANKVKIYINGVQQSTNGTQLSTDDYDSHFNANVEHNIGRQTNNAVGEPSWYLAETVMVEGSQLDPTSFGQVDTSTNRWVPKDVSGLTFGDEGWYLEYDGTGFGSGGSGETPSNGAGKDSSGNGNHWEEENDGGSDWATTDQFVDTPSKNFNVFDGGLNGAGTLSEGNTQITTATNQRTTYTTINIPATGKWYWEVDVTNYVSGGGSFFGIVEFDELVTGNNPNNGIERKVIFDNFAGNAYVYSTTSLGTTWCNTPGNNSFNADGDILQFALDQDAGKLFIGNNNTWFRAGGARDSFANATTVGQQTFNTGVKRRFLIGRGGSFNETYAINFGQQANTFSGSSTTFNADADGFFVYTPPTDYKALNQDNLDDTASKITAWAWIKNRDASDNHILVDRVRGTGKDIHSNSTDAEATNANTVQRFLQRGVQVGNNVEVNTSGESYVLWQWLLGDSATTGSTNSEGSLNTSVIAADAGHFSVVSWTMSDPAAAKTLGHGLSGAPELIIVKNRTDAGTNWPVFSEAAGNTKYQYLSTTAAAATFNMWQNTSPTSTVFSVNSNNEASGSANDEMIAYCFRSVPGVCKVSKYTGNGDSTDGPYISLGFTPRYILIKNIDAAQNWLIWDTARSSYNPLNNTLFADLNSGESTSSTYGRDILSDGFKLRGSSHAIVNASGNNYLYMAMADIGGNGTLPPIYGR